MKKRDDGIVIFDPEKSKGQRQLVDACPHGAVWWNEEKQIPQIWTFGQPATVSGAVTLTATPAGGTGSCQHGIAARGNVLIDIRQCVPAGPNNVAALVTATAAKVPRQ